MPSHFLFLLLVFSYSLGDLGRQIRIMFHSAFPFFVAMLQITNLRNDLTVPAGQARFPSLYLKAPIASFT
jgi:hypothetical protein